MVDFALLVLRISIGTVFILHGLQAAFGLLGGPGINGFSGMLTGLGFKPAMLWAYIGAYTELLGGLFLLLGIFSRISASLIIIFMIVAAWKVHWVKGFFIQSGGFEYNFVIICTCIALVLLGPGKFSVIKKF